MAFQTNGRNMGEQEAAKETPNGSERRPGISLPDIQTLQAVWARLQLMNQQVATSHRESCDAQNYFWASIDALVSHTGAVEGRCKQYYQAYRSAREEMHDVATNCASLQKEVEKAVGLTEAASQRADELEDVSTNLAEQNVSLQQDLEQDREKIRTLQERISELEASSRELAGEKETLQQDLALANERIRILEGGVARVDLHSAGAPKDNGVHELDAIDQRSPDARIMELYAKLVAMEGEYDEVVGGYKSALANAGERISAAETKLKQFEDREACTPNLESDSVISVTSKRVSLSPGPGGRQNAEDHKSSAELGKRKQPKRKARARKLAPTNPDLRIVCP